MDQTVLAVRAVTSQYAKRFLRPVLAIGLSIYILLIALIGWIATSVNEWWWLLAVMPTFIILIAVTIWLIVWIILTRLAPNMNHQQKSAAKKFIKRIDKVAEHLGTPRFVIFYRIVRDVMTSPTSGRTFIGEIAQEPGEMRSEFDHLRSLF